MVFGRERFFWGGRFSICEVSLDKVVFESCIVLGAASCARKSIYEKFALSDITILEMM